MPSWQHDINEGDGAMGKSSLPATRWQWCHPAVTWWRCGVQRGPHCDANTRATTSVWVGEGGYHNQHHGVDAYAIVAAELSMCAPPFQLRLNDKDDDNWSLGLFASAKSWLRSQHDRLYQLKLEQQVEDQ
jgi:hypothetical protein